MREEFEFQDLSDSMFWGVDLKRSTIRSVDLFGARISHSRLVGVTIDAEIGRLVVNGVDVTEFVNGRDEWFPLRSRFRPVAPVDMREGRDVFAAAWEGAIGRARELADEARHRSVDGEWSFVQTLRHLVFATDKWCTVALLGGTFRPIGLPNSGWSTSSGQGWTWGPC